MFKVGPAKWMHHLLYLAMRVGHLLVHSLIFLALLFSIFSYILENNNNNPIYLVMQSLAGVGAWKFEASFATNTLSSHPEPGGLENLQANPFTIVWVVHVPSIISTSSICLIKGLMMTQTPHVIISPLNKTYHVILTCQERDPYIPLFHLSFPTFISNNGSIIILYNNISLIDKGQCRCFSATTLG